MKISQIEPLYINLKLLSEKELPVLFAYKIAKILSKVEEDYEFYSSKLRKIIDKYGVKDENNQIVIENDRAKIDPEYFTEAEKALIDLNTIEVEDITIKITLKELEDTGLTISPSQLQSLLPIIED